MGLFSTASPIIVITALFATQTPTEKSYRLAVTVLGIAAAVGLLYVGRVLIVTMIIAAIIAFLLEPGVQLFMRFRIPRGLASFFVCSIALMGLYLAGVGIYTEALLMTEDLPAYATRINQLMEAATTRAEQIEGDVSRLIMPRRRQQAQPPAQPPGAAQGKRGKLPDPPPIVPYVQEVRVQPEPRSLFTFAYESFRSFYDVLLMASFVPFLVYFWLAWGDQMRSRLLSSLEGETRDTAENVMDGVGSMVRAYVIGNSILGIFLSVASSVLFAFIELPYWIVVGPVSGFLSLVPYIGLPLALIPPMLAALPVKSEPGIYFFLAGSIALLHLIALNLLYPKFVGSRVHLNPLVATVALMFWGIMWGAIGLVLAIPITAAVRAVCENVEEWKPYGRLLGD